MMEWQDHKWHRWRTSFSFALLMGGKGRRLGHLDKAGMCWNGQTLAYHASQCGFQVANEVLWIGAQNPPQFYGLSPEDQTLNLDHLTLYSDVQEGSGCLAGILSALHHAQSEWVWIVACDLPFLSPQLLLNLLEPWSSLEFPPSLSQYTLDQGLLDQTKVPRLLAYQTQMHFHPLCALWHKSLYGTVQRLLGQNRALQSIKNKPFVQTQTLQNPLSLFNLNTPEDIKRLSALAISTDLSILTKNLKLDGGNQS